MSYDIYIGDAVIENCEGTLWVEVSAMKRPYDLHALSRLIWPDTDMLSDTALYCARIEALGDMVTGRERHRPAVLTSYERTLIRRFLAADSVTDRQSLVAANEESTG